MILKTIQWNIGGGKIRTTDSDSTQDKSYCVDNLEYIIEKIKELEPDIVTLQETHSNPDRIQAKIIAEKTGLPFWINDEYDDSHIDRTQRLCQSVLSKYPITQHVFSFFLNPHFKITSENGENWTSHDKGYTSIVLNTGNTKLNVGTLHCIPFKVFAVEYSDPKVIDVLKDIEEKILTKKEECLLLQGDFNLSDSSLKKYFPKLLETVTEIESSDPTTPKGRIYDHVLYKNITLRSHKVISDVLTDHYLVYSEFEI